MVGNKVLDIVPVTVYGDDRILAVEFFVVFGDLWKTVLYLGQFGDDVLNRDLECKEG